MGRPPFVPGVAPRPLLLTLSSPSSFPVVPWLPAAIRILDWCLGPSVNPGNA